MILALSASPASPPAPRVGPAVAVLAAAAFFSGTALRVCDSLIPRLAAEFRLSTGTAGAVVLTFAVAYSLMQLVFGPLGDRFGKGRMVTLAVAGSAVMALASALAPDFGWLLAARVGWGMAAAGIIPLAMAWIGDAVPYERRQATLARLLLGTLSGMMGGQLIGGLFADSSLGWRGAFGLLAVGYGVIAALLVLRPLGLPGGPAPADRPATGFTHGMRLVLGDPWARKVITAAALGGIFLNGPMAYLPAYLHARFGIALAAASGLLALYAVGGLVYAMLARHIVLRFGERRMVATGGIIMGLGYLLWWGSPVVWTAAPVALAAGFGTYLYHNTLQTHATQMMPAVRGTAVSMFAFCLFMGHALGVMIAGQAYDLAGPTALLLPSAVALPAVGWWFARALRKRAAAAVAAAGR